VDRASESRRQLQTIRADLENLRRFAEGIERNLRSEAGETAGAVDSDDGVWQLHQVLPWLYRGSALLTVLGFLEHNLNAVCETLRRERGIQTPITDLPGKGLRRARLYLQKHLGIDFPVHGEAWNTLLKYSDIRNLIAHRDGLVKDDDPELLRFIDADPSLSLDAGGRVRLEQGVLPALIDQIGYFFEELAQKIEAGS
jgi:hypothetical protein